MQHQINKSLQIKSVAELMHSTAQIMKSKKQNNDKQITGMSTRDYRRSSFGGAAITQSSFSGQQEQAAATSFFSTGAYTLLGDMAPPSFCFFWATGAATMAPKAQS